MRVSKGIFISLDCAIATYSLVVGLDDISQNDLTGSDTTVVGTLGGGETGLGPAEGAVIKVQKCVFLLETEPGLMCSVSLRQLSGLAKKSAKNTKEGLVAEYTSCLKLNLLGVPSDIQHSVRTRMLSCRRKGSGKTATGRRYVSFSTR